MHTFNTMAKQATTQKETMQGILKYLTDNYSSYLQTGSLVTVCLCPSYSVLSKLQWYVQVTVLCPSYSVMSQLQCAYAIS